MYLVDNKLERQTQQVKIQNINDYDNFNFEEVKTMFHKNG